MTAEPRWTQRPEVKAATAELDEALGRPGLLALAERFADEGWTQKQFSGWLRSQIRLYGTDVADQLRAIVARFPA